MNLKEYKNYIINHVGIKEDFINNNNFIFKKPYLVIDRINYYTKDLQFGIDIFRKYPFSCFLIVIKIVQIQIQFLIR